MFKRSQHKKRTESLIEMSRSNLPKAVLLLAWPIIVEMLLQSTVGIADTAMVGRLGPASIAAVGLGNQFVMFLLTIFAAVRTGATVLVARSIGAEDFKGANDAARQALIVTLFFGLTVAFIGVFFPEAGYRLLGAGEDVIAVGAGYMRWRALAALFACIIMVVTGILRGCGDTFTAMKVNVTVNLLNIFFNWILIFGNLGFPTMGTAGAGAATMVARLLGAGMMITVLFRGKANVQLKRSDSFRLHFPTLKRLFKIGVPAGIEQMFMRGAQIFFTMIVTNLGTAMYAAHQIVLRADSLAFMPGFGFSVAATALVGQNLGAEQPDEAKRAGNITMYMAIGLMTAVGALLFIFAKQAMMFFTDDLEVIQAGIPILKMMAFSMPFMAVARVAAGALRGAGDTKYVMWGTGASIWVARLGTAFVLVNMFNLGLFGAWIGMFADHVVRALIFFVRYLKGKWIFIKI
jgi:putative MATE family efflux protein